jgi:hypothetical protein
VISKLTDLETTFSMPGVAVFLLNFMDSPK